MVSFKASPEPPHSCTEDREKPLTPPPTPPRPSQQPSHGAEEDEERKTVEQVLWILLSEEDGVRPPSLKLGALSFQDPRHQLWGLWELLLSRCYTLSECEALTKQGTPGSHTSHHHRRPISVQFHTISSNTVQNGDEGDPPQGQTPTFTLCALSR